MMLDEIDKLGAGIQGDPSSAMLEVLDPEQNATFRDNYLGVPFDLSRVVFIATANMLDTIPGPLRDRMEIITLAGYTPGEKLQIAQRYLVRRQLEANGLKPDQARDRRRGAAPTIIARLHPRSRRAQPGARDRPGAAPRRGRHRRGPSEPRRASAPDDLHGHPRAAAVRERGRRCAPACRASPPAWPGRRSAATSCSSRRRALPGDGKLILTGQLGEVMRESAQAALSLVKSRAAALGIDPARLREDATSTSTCRPARRRRTGRAPGVAMFMALASLLTGRTVRSDTAMTGEISLRGLVLPVGGIKEKVVAAAAAGITRVMLPARNRPDYEEIPAEARDKLEFVWLEKVEDAVAAALEPA